MKTLIIALMMLAGTAGAQEITAIDLNAPLADARLGMAWNDKGEQLGVAQVPLIYWVSSTSGEEYGTLNFGASDKLATGKANLLVSAGPRIDTFFRKASRTNFSKKHLRFAVLPPLQVSVIMATSDFFYYRPMVSLITRFGGR